MLSPEPRKKKVARGVGIMARKPDEAPEKTKMKPEARA
jgi:hypothetical protein